MKCELCNDGADVVEGLICGECGAHGTDKAFPPPERKKRKRSKPKEHMTVCEIPTMYVWELPFVFSGEDPKHN